MRFLIIFLSVNLKDRVTTIDETHCHLPQFFDREIFCLTSIAWKRRDGKQNSKGDFVFTSPKLPAQKSFSAVEVFPIVHKPTLQHSHADVRCYEADLECFWTAWESAKRLPSTITYPRCLAFSVTLLSPASQSLQLPNIFLTQMEHCIVNKTDRDYMG